MPVVIVEWEDACLDTEFDGIAAPDVGKTVLLQDVGFLFRKNKRVVVLVGCRCLANKTVRWVNTIPARLVKRITFLKEETHVAGIKPVPEPSLRGPSEERQ